MVTNGLFRLVNNAEEVVTTFADKLMILKEFSSFRLNLNDGWAKADVP